MSNTSFVILAYSLTYIGLAAYALRLLTRQRALQRQWEEGER